MADNFFGTSVRDGNVQGKYINDTVQWMKAPDGNPIEGLEPTVFWQSVMLMTKSIESSKLFYGKAGSETVLPVGNGDQRPQWNRMEPLIEHIKPIAEGQMPTPEKVKQNMVRGQVFDYGRTILFTSKVQLLSMNDPMKLYVAELKALGERIDNLLAREAMLAESQDWLPKVTVRKDITLAAVADATVGTAGHLIKAGTILAADQTAALTNVFGAATGVVKAGEYSLTKLSDFYIFANKALVGTSFCAPTFGDLLAIENWFEARRVYGISKEAILSRATYNALKSYMFDISENKNVTYIDSLVQKGELPLLNGWNFMVDTMTKQELVVGTVTLRIHQNVVLGDEREFKKISRGSQGWKLFIKAAGSAGTADILDQVAGAGIKAEGKGYKVTDPDAIVVIYAFNPEGIATYSETHRTVGNIMDVLGTNAITSTISRAVTGDTKSVKDGARGGFVEGFTTTDGMSTNAGFPTGISRAAVAVNTNLLGSSSVKAADWAKVLGIAVTGNNIPASDEISLITEAGVKAKI